jgi:hypothetical protein
MTAPLPPPSWTVTSVLERSYLLGRDNFAAFITISLIFGAVSMVVDILSLGLLAGIVHLVAGVAASICITWGTFQAVAGRKPQWEQMLRQLQAPLFGRLLLLGCIAYLVIAISTIVIVGPFFLLPLWAVAIPAMMAERTDLGDAFNRSMDLTRNRRLPILGAFVLWTLIVIVGGALIVFLLGQGAFAHLVLWVYGAVAEIFIQPLPAIFYLLLREEKESALPTQVAGSVG